MLLGVPLAWLGLFPQHMERFGFHTPLSQAGSAPMDTQTPLPVPGYPLTHPQHPSVLGTGVAVPGHPQGCDQGAGATCLRGVIPMGRSLDLASHLPKNPRHGALDDARDAIGMRWDPPGVVAGQAEPSRSHAAARHRGN